MACDHRLEAKHHIELAFTTHLAAKLAVDKPKNATFQPIIGNFVWNLTEKNLEVIQATLSYPFYRHQIYQMLTSIATSATTTTADLLTKLSGIVGMSPSAAVSLNRPSTSSSAETHSICEDIPVILKAEQLSFAYPLESFFGITIESLISSGDCSLSDIEGEFADIVVEEVYHLVNKVMNRCLLKVNTASSPCIVYFCPDDYCADIGEFLISAVLHKLGVLHCRISHKAAAAAIVTVLSAINNQLPFALRPSKSAEATGNIIEYISEDVIHAWSELHTTQSRTEETGHVPNVQPTFESIRDGLSFILQQSVQLSAPNTTGLFDSLMIGLYMTKSSDHFSFQDNGFKASERLHQKLGDVLNCVLQCKTQQNSDSEEFRMPLKDFLHYFVEELVQRLFVTSTFPCPEELPENTPVMPFIIKEEDFGPTVVDHLTDLVVSQVFNLLAKRFPPGIYHKPLPVENTFEDVSVQYDPPKLTFREKFNIMKSNVLGKLKKIQIGLQERG